MREFDIIYGGRKEVKEQLNELSSKQHETFRIEKAVVGRNESLIVIVSFIPYNND